MSEKLVRNTSTEELRQWWDAVERIAANAPQLNLGASPGAPRAPEVRREGAEVVVRSESEGGD
jgi:hypothetical protein